MNKLAGVLGGLLVPAFVIAVAIATPAMAQEKKAEMKMAKAGEVATKEIEQNDKLRVYEATFKPGDAAPSAKRPLRAVRALTSGTLERTYEDGKKELIQWKAGEARIVSEPRPYAIKNVGKTVVHLYIVVSK
jgi:hypothetical protein